MMEEAKKRDIKKLLKGNMPARESQKLLSKLAEKDLKEFHLEEDLVKELENYRKANPYDPVAVPKDSGEVINTIWQKITSEEVIEEQPIQNRLCDSSGFPPTFQCRLL